MDNMQQIHFNYVLELVNNYENTFENDILLLHVS